MNSKDKKNKKVKTDHILKELCHEVLYGDLSSNRFNRLWLESEIQLEDDSLDIANTLLHKYLDSMPESLQEKRLH